MKINFLKKIKSIIFPRHPELVSPYSKMATFLLCLFAGFIGAHRFYTRRYISSFFMMITFGYCLVGVFVDLYKIRQNKFYDWRGRLVKSVRTKNDQYAILFSLLSPFVAYKVIPTLIILITDIVLVFGEQYSLIDDPEPIRQYVSKTFSPDHGVSTHIEAPALNFTPIDKEVADKEVAEENTKM